jgi:outer membrane biosynthesis protein TonB
VWHLLNSCAGFLGIIGGLLAIGTLVLAAAPLHTPRQSPISESDVAPHSRPLTHAQLLDEYLARLQEQLKLETRSIEASGLVEVKLTVRQDGSVTFAEIVVLDGPATLRNDLLPLVNQLGPLPPPPIGADILTVSLLLPLRYPGPDLLDSIGQAP